MPKARARCGGGLLGQQNERVDVTRPEDPEMPVIQRSQLRFVEALNDSEYGSVYQPHIRVPVLVANLTDSTIVGGEQIFDYKCPLDDLIDECDKCTDVQLFVDPVVDFAQYRRGNDQRLCGLPEQTATPMMVRVTPVNCG
jgi:hypothetical protein